MATPDPTARPLVPLPPSPPAGPGLLADLNRLADAAETHVSEALSPRTRAAYASDWRQWQAWCERHDQRPVPVDPALVRLYITDMASQVRADGTVRFKVSTIDRHVAALAWRSRMHGGIHDLARHPQVSPVLAGIRRARAERPRRSRPLLRDDVERLVGSMSHHTWPDGVKAARDTFATLLAFAAALRRSEVAALRVGDVIAITHDGLHVRLGATKTDQEGKGVVLAVPYGERPVTCVPCARTRWLRLLAASSRAEAMRLVFDSGPPSTWAHVCRGSDPAVPLDPASGLLRTVPKSGRPTDAPITASGLNQMLKRRLAAAGYDPEPYGFHSLRAGFVTQARRNGADTRSVRRQTRHTTDAMVDVYDREYLPLSGNAVTDLGL